ncbi:MAG TPA: hypothetical protein VL475_07860, partial [Planctomycetaceae bacterium]|nr:hypothetical protein [Planctomycetaceae bacterium]
DGLGHSSLDAHPEFSSQVRPNSRVGLGGLVEVFPEFYRTGTIYMGIGHGGYVGLVRVEDERLNVAAAVDAALVREQHSPAKALQALLREAGFPPIAALDQTAWQGTLPLTRCSPRLADRRLLLLGDAAGYVEPFTGEGIAWALTAASQIAPFAIRGLADWTEQLENEWTLEMRRRVTRRQRWCRRLALALRFPRVCRGLLATISLAPRLAQPVIRALNAPPLSAEGLI